MKTQDRKISHLIEDETVEVLQRTLELVGAVVNAVSDVVTRAMATPARQSLPEVVQGVLQGVVSLRGDSRLAVQGINLNVELAVKGIMIGVIRGVGRNDKSVLNTIVDVSGFIITAVITSGIEDITVVANAAVEGAIEGAQSMDLNLEDAGSAAAAGVIMAANGLSDEAGLSVQKVVVRTFGSVKVLPEKYLLKFERQKRKK